MTIETLVPDDPSVASVGGESREFAAWQRSLQRQLAKVPAMYDVMTTAEILEAVSLVRERAAMSQRIVETRSGPHLLRVRPVLGPAGDTHAVQLWMGPASVSPPVLGPAVGAIWDLDSQTIAVPSGIVELAGVAPEEYTPRMSIAELFHRVSTFDRHGEVLDLLYDPKPGAKLQFEAAITDGAGCPSRWRISMRAREDQRGRGAWWLIEDITSPDHPAQAPGLERVGLREAHRRAGTRLAVVQLAHGAISHWLTDPAPWIRWDYLFSPRDVFHPDDRARLVTLSDQVSTGYAAGIVVRTLNYDGGYTPTSLLVYPYPGYSRQPLAIVQFVHAAPGSPLSTPASRTVWQVRDRTSPVGYDDQLRARWGRGSRSL
ncbi:GAF domain-containing protein [Nocardia sp. NBC_00511]|uniref:GAF domain-containing protein n=1 Tax=Nocardia sp. NBC_00511 TaxID=2903591 RepID=UPI002F91838D